jgi:hypothetical protein
MPGYISPNSSDNSTYEQAKKLMKQRKLVQLNSFGLYLQDSAGKYLDEESFNEDIQHAIANKTKMCFVIKYQDRPPNESSANIGESDDYINVGKNLKMIKDMSPNLEGAIAKMIDNDYPGQDPQPRINAMPGVSEAKADAIETAWDEA